MSTMSFIPASRREDPIRSGPVMSPAVFATSIFVIAELMFFMALLSAYHVVKSRAFSDWTPPNDVRLPVFITSINTLILMASGFLLLGAERLYRNPQMRERASKLFMQAFFLGSVFVGVQGFEWMKLINLGFTIGAGLFSATFFLLIGSHGLHALGALVVMAFLIPEIKKSTLPPERLRAMTVFWFFVVGMWPILFGTVYF